MTHEETYVVALTQNRISIDNMYDYALKGHEDSFEFIMPIEAIYLYLKGKGTKVTDPEEIPEGHDVYAVVIATHETVPVYVPHDKTKVPYSEW